MIGERSEYLRDAPTPAARPPSLLFGTERYHPADGNDTRTQSSPQSILQPFVRNLSDRLQNRHDGSLRGNPLASF